MNEEGFYSTRLLRPFETNDLVRQDARLRSIVSLGTALWGRTALDLQHQLLRPYPEISTGFDLADFGELQSVSARFEAIDLTDLRNACCVHQRFSLRRSRPVRIATRHGKPVARWYAGLLSSSTSVEGRCLRLSHLGGGVLSCIRRPGVEKVGSQSAIFCSTTLALIPLTPSVL